MRRHEALRRLGETHGTLRAMGATSLFLFGSVARDEARETSDLDLFIDYDDARRFNAFDLMDIKTFLETTLAHRVDMTTRDGLHPKLRQAIEATAIRVF